MAITQHTDLAKDATAAAPARSDAIPHVKILTSYIGLLCLGKSDFEAIEAFRQDPYFAAALDVDQVPSAVTLRQRFDAHAAAFIEPIIEASIAFLQRMAAPITPLANGLVALDADVTPLNNAKTKKEGVSRTYKGDDGLAPMAAYLGQEGYCLEWELRAGSQHCQKGTPVFLQRVLARARRLTALPLLLRLDSGNDALCASSSAPSPARARPCSGPCCARIPAFTPACRAPSGPWWWPTCRS